MDREREREIESLRDRDRERGCVCVCEERERRHGGLWQERTARVSFDNSSDMTTKDVPH